jgi:hypothetical protein
MLLPILVATSLMALPQGRGHDKGLPPGLAKKGGLPPGLAKKGGLPPGLAKHYGRAPERPYVAVDPRYQDRAWFLIEGRWELRKGFSGSVQAEVRDLLRLPMAPPPVPLPRVGVDLHVVLFN